MCELPALAFCLPCTSVYAGTARRLNPQTTGAFWARTSISCRVPALYRLLGTDCSFCWHDSFEIRLLGPPGWSSVNASGPIGQPHPGEGCPLFPVNHRWCLLSAMVSSHPLCPCPPPRLLCVPAVEAAGGQRCAQQVGLTATAPPLPRSPIPLREIDMTQV